MRTECQTVYLHPRNMCQANNFSFLCDTFCGVVVCNLSTSRSSSSSRVLLSGNSLYVPVAIVCWSYFLPSREIKTRIKRGLCDFFPSSCYFQFANTTTVTLSCGNFYLARPRRVFTETFLLLWPSIQNSPSGYRSSLVGSPTHPSSCDVLLRQVLQAPVCRISCVSSISAPGSW